jgi:hypothetical protein
MRLFFKSIFTIKKGLKDLAIYNSIMNKTNTMKNPFTGRYIKIGSRMHKKLINSYEYLDKQRREFAANRGRVREQLNEINKSGGMKLRHVQVNDYDTKDILNKSMIEAIEKSI